MKNLKQLLALSFLSLLLTTHTHALAQGQIDFAKLASHYGEPKVEVNLSASLMKIISSFADDEDPEAANILSKLESIKVRVYGLNGELETANSVVDKVSKDLKIDDWETLVTVNDNQEKQKVRIFSKSTNDVIDGVVVMVVSPENEGGEAVFINIVGEIDPEKIGKVAESLDIKLN